MRHGFLMIQKRARPGKTRSKAMSDGFCAVETRAKAMVDGFYVSETRGKAMDSG
jgi:hypothetical protein